MSHRLGKSVLEYTTECISQRESSPAGGGDDNCRRIGRCSESADAHSAMLMQASMKGTRSTRAVAWRLAQAKEENAEASGKSRCGSDCKRAMTFLGSLSAVQ
jgi:hypothetical protein